MLFLHSSHCRHVLFSPIIIYDRSIRIPASPSNCSANTELRYCAGFLIYLKTISPFTYKSIMLYMLYALKTLFYSAVSCDNFEQWDLFARMSELLPQQNIAVAFEFCQLSEACHMDLGYHFSAPQLTWHIHDTFSTVTTLLCYPLEPWAYLWFSQVNV